jgi:hypothetical protein
MTKLLLKKLLLVVMAVMLIAASLPLAAPANFHGGVKGYAVGTPITIWNDTGIIAIAYVQYDPVLKLYHYNVDVLGTTADEGKFLLFKVDRRIVVGRGYWHSGTTTELNLSAPRPMFIYAR